ncbi:hypothetical protein [Microbacterium arborescens]|uniref:hypothetical protein n=1 Tax=Microbacterium arborescens TaxID=33883 RepID=UPI002785EE01|nr:hypothetical protein [Microbacterium arborescens]MDQ1218034.1 hypothetical protein [Microbacterium arborescens]
MSKNLLTKTAVGFAAAIALLLSTGGAAAPVTATEASAAIVVSDVTNVTSRAAGGTPQAAAASNYVVLRDNFYTYQSCESYRTSYVIYYAYHRDSYCTTSKRSNGRHWLYVWYDYSCVDRVAPTREEL